MRQPFDGLERWAELEEWADADSWDGAEAEAEDGEAEAVLDEMSPAEAFNLGRALQQIQRGAGQALADPLVGRIAGAALPVGAGALGTLVGGPAGAALGGRLGTLAAGSLARPGRTVSPAVATAAGGTAGTSARLPITGAGTPAVPPVPPTGLPDLLTALLALSAGGRGIPAGSGAPLAAVLNSLSSVLGRAAGEADELAFRLGEGLDDSLDERFDDAEMPDADTAAHGRSAGSGGCGCSDLQDSEDWEPGP